jgi:hypothetical protein
MPRAPLKRRLNGPVTCLEAGLTGGAVSRRPPWMQCRGGRSEVAFSGLLHGFHTVVAGKTGLIPRTDLAG